MKVPPSVSIRVHPWLKKLRAGILLSAFALTFALPSPSAAQTTTVTSTTYGSGQNATVNGPTNVGTSGTVTVSSGAVVTFKASTAITLSPGFNAASGSRFTAQLTVDSDGDGIPDAWETAHGLNPASAGDAATTTTGGLTNLLEYLLGTTPGITKQTDSSNSNALKVHRPNQP